MRQRTLRVVCEALLSVKYTAERKWPSETKPEFSNLSVHIFDCPISIGWIHESHKGKSSCLSGLWIWRTCHWEKNFSHMNIQLLQNLSFFHTFFQWTESFEPTSYFVILGPRGVSAYNKLTRWRRPSLIRHIFIERVDHTSRDDTLHHSTQWHRPCGEGNHRNLVEEVYYVTELKGCVNVFVGWCRWH